MFEKEATEYAIVGWDKSQDPRDIFVPRIDETKFNDWRKGAEFGYNKANEWHNLEENPTDLPKENMKQVIVKDLDGDYCMGWYCIHQNCWYDNECPDTIDYPIKVVKWKEIQDD